MVEHILSRRFRVGLLRLIVVCVHLALLLGSLAYLLSFALHAWYLLPYPYPLDYGEGPLLSQIMLLHSGIPPWQIYSDPAHPPYIIVNYPPFYPWLIATLNHIPELVGISAVTPLHVGRFVSLLATAGSALAIFLLTRDRQGTALHSAGRGERWLFTARHVVLALLFLTIPIVREWGVLLRVDMTGVCLGLWGLVALRTALHEDTPHVPSWWSYYGWAGMAGVLLLLTLFTKPSLIAAPAAACLWLLIALLTTWQPGAQRAAVWRTALVVFTVLGMGGGLLVALLQWASGGWFLLHVVTANANRWDADLARGFWEQQAALRWMLVLAGGVSAGWLVVLRRSDKAHVWLLPLLYTAAAVPMAVGVGKVGAYTNYFLELYAGLVWLIAAALTDPRLLQQPRHLSDSALLNRLLAAPPGAPDEPYQQRSRRFPPLRRLHTGQQVAAIGIMLLVVSSFAFYPPLWSKTWLRQAGIVDENPPRLAFGRYGLWRDLQREVEIVQAQRRIHAALIREVSMVPGTTIFTDMPGVAAEAGKRARLQVFEHRQLLDQGYWEQQPLLLELANGELPLVVLDYLGNWLTPEMIEIITRRYAMDGSLGTFDIYRPVAPGPRRPVSLTLDGLHLSGYHLNEPGNTTGPTSTGQLLPLQAGNLLVVTLEFQSLATSHTETPAIWGAGTVPEVVLQLTDEDGGHIVLESERPLLYGTLHPDAWSLPVQHMQPITLPLDMPPAIYRLNIMLRNSGRDLSPPQFLTSVRVGTEQGSYAPETDYFVPAPILQGWYQLGGIQRVGNPLTPAVPFGWGVLQCFEYTCLELRDGAVVQRPLGEQLYLAETLRSAACLDGSPFTSAPSSICSLFSADWQQYGSVESMGMGISGAISRYGYMVQWTRYARLEQSVGGGPTMLGRLGDDIQRLPPGMRYRWP